MSTVIIDDMTDRAKARTRPISRRNSVSEPSRRYRIEIGAAAARQLRKFKAAVLRRVAPLIDSLALAPAR